MSWPNRGSRIDPYNVAVVISPNAGVIGTLQIDGHASRLRLFVPDRPAPESVSQDVEDDMLLIVMPFGTCQCKISLPTQVYMFRIRRSRLYTSVCTIYISM